MRALLGVALAAVVAVGRSAGAQAKGESAPGVRSPERGVLAQAEGAPPPDDPMAPPSSPPPSGSPPPPRGEPPPAPPAAGTGSVEAPEPGAPPRRARRPVQTGPLEPGLVEPPAITPAPDVAARGADGSAPSDRPAAAASPGRPEGQAPEPTAQPGSPQAEPPQPASPVPSAPEAAAPQRALLPAPPQPGPSQAASPLVPPPAREGEPRRPAPAPEQGAEPRAAAPGPVISGGSISGSTISGATITGGNISGANISGAKIEGGTISGAEISGGDIRGGAIQRGEGSRPGGAAAGAGGSGGAPPAAGGGGTGGAPAGAGAGGSGGAPPAAGGGGEGASGPSDAAAHGGGSRASGSRQARDAPAEGARKRESAPRSEGRAPSPAGSERKEAGSGGGDEDEEAAARALQRTLVQRGALLLPVWAVELVPALQYGHGGDETVATLPPSGTSPATTLAVRTRTHQMIGSLTLRLGLPWELQAEASAPVLRAWNDVALTGPGGAGRSDATGIGLGDPRLSLTRQIFRAHRSIPDVLITGTWKPAVGTSPFDAAPGRVGLGSGYDAVGGTLTASKASDPLVFVASATYLANLTTRTNLGRRDPGDTFGMGAGAVLAVSPETSLSFLIDFRFKPEDRLNGTALIGTDLTEGVLQIGLATVVSRRALLNFSVGVGLTPDAPRLQLGVSVPLRL
jgi:hypothetical protein